MEQGQMLDVAIIGGGPAGLTAAYRLRDRRVSVFEIDDQVGGRTRSARLQGEVVNLGAQFVYLGTETEWLCRELGITLLPRQPETYSCHYGGVSVVASTDDELVAGLPMCPEAKEDLREVLDLLRRGYGTYSSHGLTFASSSLARITFQEFLGLRHPEVMRFFEPACVGACLAWPHELTAQYAMRYVASYLLRDQEHRACIAEGMDQITLRLSGLLGDVVQTGIEVASVERTGEGYRLNLVRDGHKDVVDARQVVMAVPGPEVESLVPELPEWKRRAIAAVPTSPAVVMAVVLEGSPSASWNRVFFMLVEGRAFQSILHATMDRPLDGPNGGRSVLNLYVHREPAEALLDREDLDGLQAEWLEDLYAVFPDARGRVLGTQLVRWRNCFSYLKADRLDVLDDVQRPIDGLHFAGDYASTTAGVHGAIASGERVAGEILGVGRPAVSA